MSGVQIILYVLFAISVLCPIYTYALYPLVLKRFKGKNYKIDEIKPSVTVVIVDNDTDGSYSLREKVTTVRQSLYDDVEIITGEYQNASRAIGEIVVFTDTKTNMDLTAIREIVQPFADERVGCVVGMQTNPNGNSAFWKYENIIKKTESQIGCVSGANEGLFAIRKNDLPDVPDEVLNVPFYIATKITESGKAVVFEYHAMTYEGKSEGTNFGKHVADAAGYWQSLRLFPKMLNRNCGYEHGSFVYISHRVMKWFVWLNMVVMLVISGILGVIGSEAMMVLFALQAIGYAVVMLLGKLRIGGSIGKLIGIGYYFVMLNVAYVVGIVEAMKNECR